jgi:phage gp29-like protein/DNA topoisomerase IB
MTPSLKTLQPIGSRLPPRRDVIAAAVTSTPYPGNDLSSINITKARDRMFEAFEREQLPGDVKGTLASALNGDLHYQHLLFHAMIDSWPRLQKNLSEMARAASIAPWKVYPWAKRGQKPDAKAEAMAAEVEDIIWSMKPDPARGENSFEETIETLVVGYFYGHVVSEIRWEKAPDGMWKPRATKPLPARFYGYPYNDLTLQDPEDRLMLDPEGMTNARTFVDFPENRFLIGVHKGHAGHAALAAPLRSLAAYWLAAVYGLKWFMNFTQLYGIPWRHAEVANPKDRNAVAQALDQIGSTGRIVTDMGTKINVLSAGQTGQTLPQRELVELADAQCDVFILGQTLTSGTDGSGSRALGEVHQGTKDEAAAALIDFAGKIISHQLVPAIVRVNWGNREDMPGVWAKRDEQKDENALAERDEKLGITSGAVPVSKAWFYERHGIPIPADGEDLLVEEEEEEGPTMQEGDDDWLDEDESDDEEDDGEELPVAASYHHIQARASIRLKPKTRKKLKRGSSGTPTGSGMGFDPNQTRIPKGAPNAGRWTDDGLVSKGQRARKGVMRPATDEDRKRLKIAPGFKDAKVTDDPKADLLGTAINAKGKPVSFYSEAYSKKQEAAKFGRIAALDKEMPGLQSRIKADSEAGNHQALTMRLITATGMRNGGDKGGGKVATFGASNLRTDQVKVSGDTVSMDFIGKKGVRQRQTVKDPVLAKHVSQRIKDGKETVFDGNSTKTLAYLKSVSGDKFKVHDFRTWNATVTADRTIQKIAAKQELPSNEGEFKDFQMRVAKVVSRRLGNDPAMALKAYIHPAVFAGY